MNYLPQVGWGYVLLLSRRLFVFRCGRKVNSSLRMISVSQRSSGYFSLTWVTGSGFDVFFSKSVLFYFLRFPEMIACISWWVSHTDVNQMIMNRLFKTALQIVKLALTLVSGCAGCLFLELQENKFHVSREPKLSRCFCYFKHVVCRKHVMSLWGW